MCVKIVNESKTGAIPKDAVECYQSTLETLSGLEGKVYSYAWCFSFFYRLISLCAVQNADQTRKELVEKLCAWEATNALLPVQAKDIFSQYEWASPLAHPVPVLDSAFP